MTCTWTVPGSREVIRRASVAEAVLADEQDQGNRGADDGLCAQSGTLAPSLALEPHLRGQPERDEQLDELARSLARACEQSVSQVRRPAHPS